MTVAACPVVALALGSSVGASADVYAADWVNTCECESGKDVATTVEYGADVANTSACGTAAAAASDSSACAARIVGNSACGAGAAETSVCGSAAADSPACAGGMGGSSVCGARLGGTSAWTATEEVACGGECGADVTGTPPASGTRDVEMPDVFVPEKTLVSAVGNPNEPEDALHDDVSVFDADIPCALTDAVRGTAWKTLSVGRAACDAITGGSVVVGAAGGVVTVVMVAEIGDASTASACGNGEEGLCGARPR